MNKFMLKMVAGLVMSLPMIAGAQSVRPATGEMTSQWLELQRSGEQASVHPDGDSAEVSENIYQRYVKSFTHPIPETFKRDQDTQFVSGGGRSQ